MMDESEKGLMLMMMMMMMLLLLSMIMIMDDGKRGCAEIRARKRLDMRGVGGGKRVVKQIAVVISFVTSAKSCRCP